MCCSTNKRVFAFTRAWKCWSEIKGRVSTFQRLPFLLLILRAYAPRCTSEFVFVLFCLLGANAKREIHSFDVESEKLSGWYENIPFRNSDDRRRRRSRKGREGERERKRWEIAFMLLGKGTFVMGQPLTANFSECTAVEDLEFVFGLQNGFFPMVANFSVKYS